MNLTQAVALAIADMDTVHLRSLVQEESRPCGFSKDEFLHRLEGVFRRIQSEGDRVLTLHEGTCLQPKGIDCSDKVYAFSGTGGFHIAFTLEEEREGVIAIESCQRFCIHDQIVVTELPLNHHLSVREQAPYSSIEIHRVSRTCRDIVENFQILLMTDSVDRGWVACWVAGHQAFYESLRSLKGIAGIDTFRELFQLLESHSLISYYSNLTPYRTGEINRMHGKQADVSEWLNANKSLYSDLSRAARHHRKLGESQFAALLPTHVLATEEEVQEIAVFWRFLSCTRRECRKAMMGGMWAVWKLPQESDRVEFAFNE